MVESVLIFLFGIGVGMALLLLYFMAFPEKKQELGSIVFEMDDLEDFNKDIMVSTKRRKLL